MITKEHFVLRNSELSDKMKENKVEIIRLSDELNRRKQSSQQCEQYEKLLPFDRAVELTPEVMALVDGIYVFDAAHIEIKFTFSDIRGQI